MPNAAIHSGIFDTLDIFYQLLFTIEKDGRSHAFGDQLEVRCADPAVDNVIVVSRQGLGIHRGTSLLLFGSGTRCHTELPGRRRRNIYYQRLSIECSSAWTHFLFPHWKKHILARETYTYKSILVINELVQSESGDGTVALRLASVDDWLSAGDSGVSFGVGDRIGW
jgi:hypothetical protein